MYEEGISNGCPCSGVVATGAGLPHKSYTDFVAAGYHSLRLRIHIRTFHEMDRDCGEILGGFILECLVVAKAHAAAVKCAVTSPVPRVCSAGLKPRDQFIPEDVLFQRKRYCSKLLEIDCVVENKEMARGDHA